MVISSSKPPARTVPSPRVWESLLAHCSPRDFPGRRERPHRLTFAEDLRGHALLRIGEPASVGDERLLGLAHDVDEARRDGQAVDIDLGFAAATYFAKGCDAIAADGEIAVGGRL